MEPFNILVTSGSLHAPPPPTTQTVAMTCSPPSPPPIQIMAMKKGIPPWLGRDLTCLYGITGILGALKAFPHPPPFRRVVRFPPWPSFIYNWQYCALGILPYILQSPK